MIVAILRAGDYLGEMRLIVDEPHSATVLAEVQSNALILGRTEFSRCIPDMDFMAHAIFKRLVQRLRQADSKIKSLALMNVYGRVVKAPLAFAGENAMSRESHAVIAERVSRQEGVKMVGASRQRVSRVMKDLKDLEERGFIVTRDDGSRLVMPHLDSPV